MKEKSMKHLKLPKKVPEIDTMELMLNLQKEINKKVGWEWRQIEDISKSLRQQLTKDYVFALQDECHEVCKHINWKWWKRKQIKINKREIIFELIDIQHFLNSLYILWGVDKNLIKKYFIAKAKENLNRQKKGY